LKLLIADKFPKENIDRLSNVVDELEYEPELTSESIVNRIPRVNILVVRSTKVSANVIEKGENLELIVRSGAGTENIDVEAASGRGIYVSNCPGKNAVAVAELTIGLLLAVDRRIPDQTFRLGERRWDKESFARADGLKGKTFGVIGTGPVGREVIKRARAFDMSVVAWSRSLTKEDASQLGITRAENIDELIARCDIISLHLALTPETQHILSAQRIAKLKPGTIVLNTSRGKLIDNAALVEALRKGRIHAGLDVYENEPETTKGEFQNLLAGIPNWVGTHHIGASTSQAQKAIADETVRIIEEYVTTGEAQNCINLAKKTHAVCELIVRHYDKIGVLTRILNDLREAEINVHEVHNVIFEGARAAVANIELAANPPQEVLDRISVRKNEILSTKLVKSRFTSQ